MTRDEAIAAIKLRLGFYTKKESEIITELQVSQGRLEKGIKLPQPFQGIFKPWFLTGEIQTAVTQIGEDRVPLPGPVIGVHNGFLSEVENAALWILDPAASSQDPWLELEKLPFDEIQQKFPGTGMPQKYDTMGVYFRVRPTPDKVYTLKIVTNNADLFPSTGSGTNKWLSYAPEVLWAHCGMTMATALRDQAALAQFKATFDEGVEALYLNTEERLHVNRRYVMGGED